MTKTLESSVHDLADAGADAMNSVATKAREIRHDADGFVRGNPWLAVGAAAGVGLFVGWVLGHRREP